MTKLVPKESRIPESRTVMAENSDRPAFDLEERTASFGEAVVLQP
jgi:hypothetical protein